MKREIVVQGRAEARVAPDRALVLVTAEADGGSRDDAYRAATTTATAVDAVLANHAAAIGRTASEALVVAPLTRWRKGEQIRTGWRASRVTRVEITGFTDVGPLLAELVGADASVVGPTWLVDEDNAAYDEVRAAAAADARRRADAYAAGLGLTVGGVNWVAEPGLRSTPGYGGVTTMFSAEGGLALSAQSLDEDVIDVRPADLDITSQVEVSFRIDPPSA